MALRIDDTLKKIEFLFRYAGINIRSGKKKKNDAIKSKCMFVLNFFWMNTDLVCGIAWFVDGVRKGIDFKDLMYSAPCSSFSFMANFKSIDLALSEKKTDQLIENLRKLETEENNRPKTVEKEEIISTEIKFLNNVIKTINILYAVLLLAFAFSPLIIMGVKYMQTGEVELLLQFLLLYPFDQYNIKVWPFVYIRLLWTECIVVLDICTADHFFMTCCTYIRIQFRLLQHQFERIISVPSAIRDRDDFKTKFVGLVKWHQDTIGLVAQLESMYSKSMLFNFMSSSLGICLTGFNVAVVDDFSFKIIFISFLFICLVQVFFLCFFADLLLESSEQVGDAVYNSKWYTTNSSVGKQLLLVKTRAQVPCKLTAWGFADVNLNSFMRVLSTAWSYFALLQTIYGN